MNKIQAKRMLKLADYLVDVKEEQFNLNSWKKGSGKVGSCGTVACMAGWGTNIFPELKLHDVGSGESEITFNGYEGFDAIQDFFGVEHMLFHPFDPDDWRDKELFEHPRTPLNGSIALNAYVYNHFPELVTKRELVYG